MSYIRLASEFSNFIAPTLEAHSTRWREVGDAKINFATNLASTVMQSLKNAAQTAEEFETLLQEFEEFVRVSRETYRNMLPTDTPPEG